MPCMRRRRDMPPASWATTPPRSSSSGTSLKSRPSWSNSHPTFCGCCCAVTTADSASQPPSTSGSSNSCARTTSSTTGRLRRWFRTGRRSSHSSRSAGLSSLTVKQPKGRPAFVRMRSPTVCPLRDRSNCPSTTMTSGSTSTTCSSRACCTPYHTIMQTPFPKLG
jgi:hypothetical protein